MTSQLLLNPGTREIIRDSSDGPDEIVARPARPALTTDERVFLDSLPDTSPLKIAYRASGVYSAFASGAFSTDIDLTASRQMPKQDVTGVLAFVPRSTGLEGAEIRVDLIANGTHIPTFVGFREWDGSSGYLNTSGVRNCVTFFWRSGIAYFCINQQLGGGAEPGLETELTFGTLTNVTQSGSAGARIYTATAAGFANSCVAVRAWAANTDGEASVLCNYNGSGNIVLGVDSVASEAASVFSCDRGLWLFPDQAQTAQAGSFGAVNTAYNPNGFVDRVYFKRTGTTLVASYLRAGVRTTIHTWTGVPTGVLYFGVNLTEVGTNISTGLGSGLV